MIQYAVLIVCLNMARCPFPSGHLTSTFTAESRDLCRDHVRTLMLWNDRLNPDDFKIECTEMIPL